MKVEMGTLATERKKPMFIGEITFDTDSDELYLRFKFRLEEQLIRFSSALEDLPVGGI